MRIISGLRRGHKFDGPGGRELRPTSDLVREAIFNILRDEVDDRLVVDLFAGTGALGLEALSRGASRAIFVERDRETVALIRRNLATLRFEDRSTVVSSDAYRWVASFRTRPGEPVLVLIDPPYRDLEAQPKRMKRFVAAVLERLSPGSTVLLESRRPLDESVLEDPSRWETRRYGSTTLSIYREPEAVENGELPQGPEGVVESADLEAGGSEPPPLEDHGP